MARVKYGSIVSNLSGSIGSATFQKSLYGDTCRNKPNQKSSSSAIQMERRVNMMAIHNAWANLTDADRQQWNQYISFSSASIRRDRKVLLSGHSLFLQYNFLRLISGLDILLIPTYQLLPPNYQSLGLVLNPGGILDLQMFAEDMGDLQWFIVKLTSPRPPSLSFNPRGLRFISVPVSLAENWDIHEQYLSIFGALPSFGDTIHFSIRYFGLLAPILSGTYTGKTIVDQNL